MDLQEGSKVKSAHSKKVRRTDYVIVVDRNIKTSPFYNDVVKFLNYLQVRGISLELGFGDLKDNIYVKLHITKESINHFASIYDVDIDDAGHQYIPMSSLNLTIAQTPISILNRNISKRRGEATNSERILIIYGMLSEARFGDTDEDNKYGINKLLSLGAVKAVYPLHDGPLETEDSTDQFLNDRQLLLKYWASFALWYKEQPLNLIEKYYGSEVAFYFAWLGFYNQMLIPASLVGLFCFFYNVISLYAGQHVILEETCNSDLLLCPRCTFGGSCMATPLKLECHMTKWNVVFDNYLTVFFAVFMSFWATTFINLWNRFENVLKIRWNVTAATTHAKTQTRLPFKEKATHKRISVVTGQIEPYTPVYLQLCYYFLSFGTCFLLVLVVLMAVLGVIMYRIIMSALIRMTDSLFFKIYAPFFEACTSSVLQVIFIKMYGRFYGPLSEWLTNMENPRTQFEFDNSVVHKRYILGFANNYASLFYIAFFKSNFYTPDHTEVISVRTDQCITRGCMVPLCIQLFVLMLLKSMGGNILTLVVPKITKKLTKKQTAGEDEAPWEEEFDLYPAGRYLLTTEFLEMILQYGFVTFFVAAFPLAPLCALINNAMELRLDAYKLVTRYRRPVPKKQSGIGPWKDILEVITHFSIATNAFVLSFTSDFVSREVYRYQHGSMHGYIKSTLSVFDISNKEAYRNKQVGGMSENSTLCYYRALRYSSDHPRKYGLTNQHWYEIGMRLMCIIIFEHIILVANGVLAYFIPDVPDKVEKTIYHHESVHMEHQLHVMNEEAKKVRQKHKSPSVKIKRN